MAGDMDAGKLIQDMYRKKFKKRKKEVGGKNSKTELNKYLGENCEDEEDDFNILTWWKVNSPRFPVLSKLSRDVLAVPVSIVVSEVAFSTGGRVLDPFRSSLTPKIVQALICTQDWFWPSDSKLNVEEELEDLESLEFGLTRLD